MKKEKAEKLQLSKETLYVLAGAREKLEAVVGGVTASCAKTCGSCVPCEFA